jgi:hypothetical protein
MSVLALDPLHDSRHRLAGDPLARESLVWMLQLPEEDIAAFVYTWVNGESKAGAALCVFGPGAGPEPIFDVVDGIEVPEDQGFDDWRVGGLHASQGAALELAAVRFETSAASLEYEFEATHPAYAYSSHRDGCPSWLADDRFEQSGRVRGVLRVGSREIPFEGTGHRDHSWGTRDWGVAQHWKWLEAQAGPDVAVHVFEMQVQGRTLLRGYVHRDGEMAEVTSIEISYENDDALFHTSIEASVEDSAGRRTVVRGTTFAIFEFKVSPLATLNECSIAVEIDGDPGVGHVEMCWPPSYLEYLRERGA